jgi:hypothetical protein
MEIVISALESCVCKIDTNESKENILGQLQQYNSNTQSPVQFYGWDPRSHSPLLSFHLPQNSPNDLPATENNDLFIVDSLWMKIHTITNAFTAINTILQTQHIYFVEQ